MTSSVSTARSGFGRRQRLTSTADLRRKAAVLFVEADLGLGQTLPIVSQNGMSVFAKSGQLVTDRALGALLNLDWLSEADQPRLQKRQHEFVLRVDPCAVVVGDVAFAKRKIAV